uniref:Pleckstrin homology domain-containing family A member 6-like isoform X2 n=1 Tax=Petromyzon marinus TaxID=7757 RepID=A0AAJ7WNR9_PETMA|nr:pleckstrin homology domain-containing family A member 6-like isoform X2 [Petromyzon marinus]
MCWWSTNRLGETLKEERHSRRHHNQQQQLLPLVNRQPPLPHCREAAAFLHETSATSTLLSTILHDDSVTSYHHSCKPTGESAESLTSETSHLWSGQIETRLGSSGLGSRSSSTGSMEGGTITTTPNRTPTSSKKLQNFGKRSHAIQRNPNAPVMIRGWLHKQDSTGMRLWKRRWFVLADFCLFYYKDGREDEVLGSISLPSFRISEVEPSDRISRKFTFKAASPMGVLSSQAEHTGMRTYYYSAETPEEMQRWLEAMSLASRLQLGIPQSNSSKKSQERPLMLINHTESKHLRDASELKIDYSSPCSANEFNQINDTTKGELLMSKLEFKMQHMDTRLYEGYEKRDVPRTHDKVLRNVQIPTVGNFERSDLILPREDVGKRLSSVWKREDLQREQDAERYFRDISKPRDFWELEEHHADGQNEEDKKLFFNARNDGRKMTLSEGCQQPGFQMESTTQNSAEGREHRPRLQSHFSEVTQGDQKQKATLPQRSTSVGSAVGNRSPASDRHSTYYKHGAASHRQSQASLCSGNYTHHPSLEMLDGGMENHAVLSDRKTSCHNQTDDSLKHMHYPTHLEKETSKYRQISLPQISDTGAYKQCVLESAIPLYEDRNVPLYSDGDIYEQNQNISQMNNDSCTAVVSKSDIKPMGSDHSDRYNRQLTANYDELQKTHALYSDGNAATTRQSRAVHDAKMCHYQQDAVIPNDSLGAQHVNQVAANTNTAYFHKPAAINSANTHQQSKKTSCHGKSELTKSQEVYRENVRPYFQSQNNLVDDEDMYLQSITSLIHGAQTSLSKTTLDEEVVTHLQNQKTMDENTYKQYEVIPHEGTQRQNQTFFHSEEFHPSYTGLIEEAYTYRPSQTALDSGANRQSHIGVDNRPALLTKSRISLDGGIGAYSSHSHAIRSEAERQAQKRNSMVHLEYWVRTQKEKVEGDRMSIASVQTMPPAMPSYQVGLSGQYTDSSVPAPQAMPRRPDSMAVSSRQQQQQQNLQYRQDVSLELHKWKQRQQMKSNTSLQRLHTAPCVLGSMVEEEEMRWMTPPPPAVLPHPYSSPPPHASYTPPTVSPGPGTTSGVASPLRRPNTPVPRIDTGSINSLQEADTIHLQSSTPYVTVTNQVSVSHSQHRPPLPQLHRSTAAKPPLSVRTALVGARATSRFQLVHQDKNYSPSAIEEYDTDSMLSKLCEEHKKAQRQTQRLQQLRQEKEHLEDLLVSLHRQSVQLRGQSQPPDPHLQQQQHDLQQRLVSIRAEISCTTSDVEKTWAEGNRLEQELIAISARLQNDLEGIQHSQSEAVERQQAHIERELWRIQDVMGGLQASEAETETDNYLLGRTEDKERPSNPLLQRARMPSLPSTPQHVQQFRKMSSLPSHSSSCSPVGSLSPGDSLSESITTPLQSVNTSPAYMAHVPLQSYILPPQSHTPEPPPQRLLQNSGRTLYGANMCGMPGQSRYGGKANAESMSPSVPAALHGSAHLWKPTRRHKAVSQPWSAENANKHVLEMGVSSSSDRERPKSVSDTGAIVGSSRSNKMSAEEQLERIRLHQQIVQKNRRKSLSTDPSLEAEINALNMSVPNEQVRKDRLRIPKRSATVDWSAGNPPNPPMRSVSMERTAVIGFKTPQRPESLGVPKVRGKQRDDMDISALEQAVRAADATAVETPAQEIARLRAELEAADFTFQHSDSPWSPGTTETPTRDETPEQDEPPSTRELEARQRNVDKIKCMLAKASFYNVTSLPSGNDGGGVAVNSQLLEQERKITLSCALAAEASRRSKALSAKITSPKKMSSPSPESPTGGGEQFSFK